MEDQTATLNMLNALAHGTRLDMFRLLVRYGQQGLTAGEIATRLKLPAATCSFHLKELKLGGVVTCEQQGRSRRYCVAFMAMQTMLGYLLEDCCIQDNSTESTENNCDCATPEC